MTETTTRRRKVLAILAGGAVLGVGAAITLAAWNDSEFATGTFAAGAFNLEGSTENPYVWDDHESAPGAALAFAVDADKLAPGAEMYAAFALRLSGDFNANLTQSALAYSGDLDGAKVDADVVSTATFGCDEDAFAGGSAVPGTIAPGDTGIINLCIKVAATEDIEPGDTGTVTWEWVAEQTTLAP